ARRVSHPEFERADLEHVAVGEGAVGRGKRLRAHPEGYRLLRNVVVQSAVARVEVDGDPTVGLEPGDTEDMIEMGVGQPDRYGCHARRRELVRDQPRLLARIDDRALDRKSTRLNSSH